MKRFVTVLPAFFLLLLNLPDAMSQVNPQISITAHGVVELPADIIRFDIDLNAEADTPREGYELHREREKVLVRLLDKYHIGEDNIRFQPISVSKEYTNYRPGGGDKQEEVYRTHQQVSLILSDFDVYEKIQITLIEEGFDNFSGQFLSSEQEKGEDEALRRALREARKKAIIIAEETGLKLGKSTKIEYSQTQVYPVPQMENRALGVADEQSLMKYPQTVVARATVSIDFATVL